MTKQQIEKGNRLIAGFMMKNGKLHTLDMVYSCDTKNPTIDDICEKGDFVRLMHYHTSWDWLMPVVEKIESLGVSTDIHYFAKPKIEQFGFNIGSTFIGYNLDYDNSSTGKTKIETAYISVVKFIKWYNKNHKDA